MRTASSPSSGLCRQCDYPLHGLDTHRCPECGHAFDPADPATMNTGKALGAIGRRLLRPIGWPTHLLAIGVASLWLYQLALPDGSFALLVPACGASLLIAAWWISRLILRIVTVLWLRQPRKSCLLYWRRWLLVPTLAAGLLGISHTSLPLRLGFRLSRPWLKQVAREALANRPAPQPSLPAWMWARRQESRWAGIYHIDAVDVLDDQVRLCISGAGSLFTCDSGFIYTQPAESPAAAPEWDTWSTSTSFFGSTPDFVVIPPDPQGIPTKR